MILNKDLPAVEDMTLEQLAAVHYALSLRQNKSHEEYQLFITVGIALKYKVFSEEYVRAH